MTSVPNAVVAAFDLDPASLVAIPSLINQTVAATTRAGAPLIVQRLHPVFGPEVHYDIDAVTRHLAEKGVMTPRLVPTVEGRLWLEDSDGVWRAQTRIPGHTVDRVSGPKLARSAAEALARFHAALTDLDHEFRFTRAGVHDTRAHLTRLEENLASPSIRALSNDLYAIEAVSGLLLEHAQSSRDGFETLPNRLCHGDPKISNVLLSVTEPDTALCWIDLDTVGNQKIPYELGDALRSWANPRPEDSSDVEVDIDIFQAMLRGYVRGNSTLTRQEQELVVEGFQTVSLELATRFLNDAIEDHYFGWDASRYPNRRAHNIARARSQLALSRAVADEKTQLVDIAMDVFKSASD